jgi:hypothetical protein
MLRAAPTSSFLFDHPQLFGGGYNSCCSSQLHLPVPPALLGSYIPRTIMFVKEPKCFFKGWKTKSTGSRASQQATEPGWQSSDSEPPSSRLIWNSPLCTLSARNYTVFLRTVSYWRGVGQISFLQKLQKPKPQEQTATSIMMEIQAHRRVPYVHSTDSQFKSLTTQRLEKVSCKHPRKHKLFRNTICTPTVSVLFNTCESATLMHFTPEVHRLQLYPLSRLSTMGCKMVICGNNEFYSADTLLTRFPQ